MTLLIWLAVSSLLWGGLIWMTGRLLQRSAGVSGRMRQWIWRGGMLLLITPWIAAPLVMALGLGMAPAETMAIATLSTAPSPEVMATAPALDLANVETAVVENGGGVWSTLAALSLVEIALLVVIAGWLVRFVMAQAALRSLLGIVMLSREADAGVARDSVRKWTRRLKLRREPRLRVVQEQHSPFSYGMLRATVCLPEGLEEKLSRQSLDLVVGHECLHVKRGDGWLRPLERLPADIFWFNPFAWLIRRELDVARELAVDEMVVEMAEARVAYARALRDVAGISAGLPIAAPAASMALAGGRSLMLRVSRTLTQARSKPARAAVLAACVFGMIGGPIAVAQVIIAVPAPPAPPAIPSPEALEAPEAPEVPEPPVVEQQVYVSPDGRVRASFAAKVTDAGAGTHGGFRVSLESTGANSSGEGCQADLDGLGSLDVKRGDSLARGQAIGKRGNGPSLSFAVRCTDQIDAAGRLEFPEPPAAPPAPPAAPAPITHVAPAAPAAPAFPVAAPAPVAAPRALSPVSAVAPAAPAMPPTPVTAPAPLMSPAPAVAPTPPTPRAWDGRQPPVPPAAPTPPAPIVLDGGEHAVIVAPARVSASFGMMTDPFNAQQVFHQGIDIAAKAGSSVHAPVEGTVVFAGVSGSQGRTAKVEARDGVTLTFAHMDEIKVKAGDRVSVGTVVGTVGSSGRSTGPHLHLEVSKDGAVHDPAAVTGLVLVSAH